MDRMPIVCPGRSVNEISLKLLCPDVRLHCSGGAGGPYDDSEPFIELQDQGDREHH